MKEKIIEISQSDFEILKNGFNSLDHQKVLKAKDVMNKIEQKESDIKVVTCCYDTEVLILINSVNVI
jgi:hypothetical protein